MLNNSLYFYGHQAKSKTRAFFYGALCTSFLLFSIISSATDQKAFSHSVIKKLNSAGDHYQLSIFSSSPTTPINTLHQWVVEVRDHNERVVNPALIEVAGGMPGHGHGLPTQPQMSKYLGNGRYLIEGMKFNMDGKWVIKLRITTPELRDIAQFDLDVSY